MYEVQFSPGRIAPDSQESFVETSDKKGSQEGISHEEIVRRSNATAGTIENLENAAAEERGRGSDARSERVSARLPRHIAVWYKRLGNGNVTRGFEKAYHDALLASRRADAAEKAGLERGSVEVVAARLLAPFQARCRSGIYTTVQHHGWLSARLQTQLKRPPTTLEVREAYDVLLGLMRGIA